MARGGGNTEAPTAFRPPNIYSRHRILKDLSLCIFNRVRMNRIEHCPGILVARLEPLNALITLSVEGGVPIYMICPCLRATKRVVQRGGIKLISEGPVPQTQEEKGVTWLTTWTRNMKRP